VRDGILPDKAHSSIRYQDHQLYFCSASCEQFKAHPDRYLTEDASEHSPSITTKSALIR
jgi:Cu+-exporting ATPase